MFSGGIEKYRDIKRVKLFHDSDILFTYLREETRINPAESRGS